MNINVVPLPFPENIILKYFAVPYYLRKYDIPFANNDFEKMTKLIIRLAKIPGVEKINQTIQIKRFFGIEEVSTNWSVGMTLEHLVIVGEKIMEIIKQLNTTGESSITVNPALAKPTGQVADPLTLFMNHIQQYQDFIKTIDFKKNSKSSCIHPWIGPMTQKSWHIFTVIHLQTHLRQVKLILDGLKLI